MKTLVLCVKEKWTCNKNSFLPCIQFVFVCTYVYHEYTRTWLGIYFFVFSLIFWRLTMTTSFCLSPMRRFNKAD